MRRRTLLISCLVVVVALSGCAALGGDSTESGDTLEGPLTNASITVSEDAGPIVVLNYSTEEYATVILEGPSGQAIADTRIEPERTTAAVGLGEPRPGTYELVVRRGGETISENKLKFDGAKARISNVTTTWTGDSLQRVNVTVMNSGDLPLRIYNASYTARNTTVTNDHLYQWIEHGKTETISLTPSFSGTVTVTEPGEVRGDVTLNTSGKTLHGQFQRAFNGPEIAITQMNPVWNGSSIDFVTVQVKNTGDLPTHINASLVRAGDVLGTSDTHELSPGANTTLTIDSWLGLYSADAPGQRQFTVRVQSPSEFITRSFTHTIADANPSVESFDVQWGYGVLDQVSYSVRNSGDIEATFTAKLAVNGEIVQRWSSESVARNASESYTHESRYFTVTEGDQYTATLIINGDEQYTESVTRRFGSPEADISVTSSTFFDEYDSSAYELYSLDIRVSNTGPVTLMYDRIRFQAGGSTWSSSLYSSSRLKPGIYTDHYISVDSVSFSEGTHEINVDLIKDGKVVATGTVTVTAG